MKNFILYLCGFPQSRGKHGLDNLKVKLTRNVVGTGTPADIDDNVELATVYAEITYTGPYPAPTSLIQYDNDHVTVIPTGGTSATTSVYLDMLMTSPRSTTSETLTPEIELREVGTSFSNTVTHSGNKVYTNPNDGSGMPYRRSFHTAVYDNTRKRMVIFGGYDNKVDPVRWFNDTWTLTLPTPDSGFSEWIDLSPTGTLPVARRGHSAIYDSTNDRMIVFGGYDEGSNYLSDVWELDFTTSPPTWTDITPASGPTARRGHSAIYDSANERMIVFGGYDGTNHFNEVWAFDLTNNTWAQLSPLGNPPPPRRSHVAIYDSANQRMIVFCGRDDTNFMRDVWAMSLPVTGDPEWTELDFEVWVRGFVLAAGLPEGTQYHWQARVSGYLPSSSWVSYGNNPESEADFKTPSVTPVPSVDSVSLNNGNNITLIENATILVSATGTVSDPDGYSDITSVQGKLYRSGVGPDCALDDNNCYEDTSCATSSCSGNSCEYTCEFNVQFYAEPTDTGSYAVAQGWDTQHWEAWVKVIDSTSTSSTATNSAQTVDVNTLAALNVDSSITYDALDPGTNMPNLIKATNATNTGNVPIDIQIKGDDMTGPGGAVIGIENQRYATSSVAWSSGYTASSTYQTLEVDLPKPTTSPSNSTDIIYWGWGVPTSKPAGTYTGTNYFNPVED